MKYTPEHPPLQCMQTQSTCYRNTYKMTIKGILWHSTGANNPYLKRYVQPSDNAKDRAEWLSLLGRNTNGNDWNHIYRKAGLNAWIGKLASGEVATVQTMPWNYAPWGCGAGKYGSLNSNFIQWEICEDGLKDPAYFESVYRESCELTAYLCKLYNIDPMGTTTVNGRKVPTIVCHWDSYIYHLGSGHSDVYHWTERHDKCMGKSMDDVRHDVKALMEEVEDLTKAETLSLIREEISKISIPDAAGTARNVIADTIASRQSAPVAGWAKENMQLATWLNLLDGTRPQDYLTRQEAAVLAVRMLGLADDTASEWSKDAREWAVAKGLVTGEEVDGETDYNWKSPVTKEQMAAVMYRLSQLLQVT